MQKKPKPQKQPSQNSQLLSMLRTGSQLVIELPLSLKEPSIDQVLLGHYVKAKIMQKKKICMREPIHVTIFGRESVLWVRGVERLVNQGCGRADGEVLDDQMLIVTDKTIIQFTYPHIQKSDKQGRSLSDVPKFYGDNQQYNNFKKIVWQNFKLRQKLFKVKLGSIRGIIIGGPTGTGKSTFIRTLKLQFEQQQIEKNEKVHFHVISATQLLSRVVGGAQQYVRKTFQTLSSHKYSVFVIQDMHLLFGQKQLSSHETTLATLFSQMDSFQKALIVIGTYNSERELSSVVFQSGRFEKEISLNLPNHHQRLMIIKSMFEDLGFTDKFNQDQIKQFNLRLNGFSIGEIKQILRDAFIMKGDNITKDILFQILKQYRPSQIKQLIVQVPQVYWSGIGGYEQVKHEIRKVTELPLKHPQKFQKLGIQPSKGVLLYGPPGCSKTMMAKAIATQSKLNFIGIKGPQLFSKYVGESQRAIRNIFRRARAFSPCIIFFDQIDALASQRSGEHNDVTNRLLGQLLTQMDGVEGLKQVIIIAATNRPQILDEALTRPGRFDHLIYVGPPDLQARKQIFKICLKKTPIKESLQDICSKLSEKTDNYTGAEITLLCRQAALLALEENLQNTVVAQQHFEKALTKVKSRLTNQSIARYLSFQQKINGSQNQVQGIINAFGNLNINNSKNSANSFKF